jgi:hypothetical protein
LADQLERRPSIKNATEKPVDGGWISYVDPQVYPKARFSETKPYYAPKSIADMNEISCSRFGVNYLCRQGFPISGKTKLKEKMSNDFQRDVAKLLLRRLDSYGFALSGGLALGELGLTNRPTKDIDLFTSSFDNDIFARNRQGICSLRPNAAT